MNESETIDASIGYHLYIKDHCWYTMQAPELGVCLKLGILLLFMTQINGAL